MAGWRKAVLSMLGRGGGGSTGSLQAHLQGHGHHMSPSSSTSSLAGYKPRGGKHGGGGKAVVGCFFAALALAIFYVSVVTSGPADDDSSPATTSSALLLSWLRTSNSSTAPAEKSLLPPHLPIPPAVNTSSSGTDQQRATVSRRVRSSAADNSSASSEAGSGQATPVRGQTTSARGSPLQQDAGNNTNAEPAGNGTREEEEPRQETATPQPQWRRTGRANNSSTTAAVSAAGDTDEADTADDATGNSTDIKTPSIQEIARNASIDDDNAQSTTPQAVLSSPPQRKEKGHRHRRARRRKDTVLLAAQVLEHSDRDKTGANTSTAATASRNETAGVNASSVAAVGPGNNRIVWTSGVQDLVSFARCDVFNGRWVRDESYGFYPPKSCPHIDDDFNCHKNGRADSDFLKWRWQPHGCDIPRLNATEFLERLRGQRIIFVGDSLNRNMWESLVCTLRYGVRDKRNVYEASGRNQFKTRGYYSFKFREYNCSVDFIRSTFLVKEVIHTGKNGTEDGKLKLDELDAATPAYQTANIVVFNTGHWWTHSKTSKGYTTNYFLNCMDTISSFKLDELVDPYSLNYYQEGNHVYPSLEVLDAYKKALTTWARWVDKNIDSRRTQVVFRGYSLAHFRGGLWNSGGKCHRETEPIFNETYLTEYPEKMVVLEQVLRRMKTPVIYLNISRLTDYRKDGHPSVYRIRYDTEEERMAAVTKQDCSHWCLPGVPDTWNELLYASLLQAGKGSWKL